MYNHMALAASIHTRLPVHHRSFAEHHTNCYLMNSYYPMLGMAPFVVLAADDAFKRCKITKFLLPAGVSFVVIATFSIMTWKQIDVWRNSLALWEDAMSKAPPGTWYEKSSNTNFIKEGYVESLIVEATRLTTKENSRMFNDTA
jgi:hypothetical protein